MKRLGLMGCLTLWAVACGEIIEVEDISDRTVTILAPTDHAALDTLGITFTWEATEGAENYHLQVVKPNFEKALQIVRDTVLARTNFTTAFSEGNYQWRIRAENSGYATPYSTLDFSVEK